MTDQGASSDVTKAAAAGAGVLLTLGASQFLMTLDSSVMNVSMATVANDLDTTVTGLQTAITLYTLVMATLMITGGKIGSLLGRRRAFAIGCVIYGAGSFVTGLAPNLPTMIIGWSLLEGMGAALIMPAVVALVAANFGPSERAKAYGLVAAAGAIAVAVGPLIGGAATTFLSWRVVFFSEVVVVIAILALSRRVVDTPRSSTGHLDFIGTVLSVAGLGTAVYGILRSSEWGWLIPKTGAPSFASMSLTFWLLLVGMFIVWLFIEWQNHLVAIGRDPLVRPAIFANRQLTGGLLMFTFQFLLQAGVFFIIPLFLSVVLELSAIQTGLRVMPLSLALLAAALGVPRLFPTVSPRRMVRVGLLLMLAGILLLVSGIDIDATAAVVMFPMLLIGLGIGTLASQLGSIAVSAVSTSESGEVGGLQNTATNLGASIGTALAGSVLITVLTASLLTGISNDPNVPESVKQQATVSLAPGVPFISDAALSSSMAEAGASPQLTDDIVSKNRSARIEGLHAALSILAIIAVISLLFTRRLPTMQPASEENSAVG